MQGAGPGSRARIRGAFTIAELVVVVGLVALLAAVVAPRFAGRRAFDERLFQEELAAAVRYAQKVAVASGCPVRVSFAGGGYALAQRSGCTTGPFDRPVGAPEAPADPFSGTAPAGVALGASVDPFVFDAFGRARTPAGAVTDVSVAAGARTLQVVGETGFVDAS